MKERQWLAVIVGVLGAYFLVHAFMTAYALYFGYRSVASAGAR
jgi:hypothetical protein